MAGLFGFFLRQPRPEAWMAERLRLLHRSMVSRPGHAHHLEIHPQAAFGISGPGLLDGTLQAYRHPGGSIMLAEGEVYRVGGWTPVAAPHGQAWPLVLDQWTGGGAAALNAVDGLYTLVRYDPESPDGPRLSLVNDRYGSRRLFVLDDGEAVVFAADFPALAAWLGKRFELDRAFIEETICFPNALGRRTWARQVELFDPRTLLEATSQGVTRTAYWDWSDLPEPGSTGGRDPVAETWERWQDVMRVRLSGQALGQQLSGGLDSRLILATARGAARDWPTLTYGERGSDEVRFAERAAAVAGSRWTLLELPGPDWLARRVETSLENGGFIDLVNCHHAGRLDEVAAQFRIEINGFCGDFTLGDTYQGLDALGVFSKMPYWDSPVSVAPADAMTRITEDLGTRSTWGYMMDTKVRRHVNWWQHMAVNDVESRKPFLDYQFLEFCAGLPPALRVESRMHTAMLRRYFPALARVPIQRTGVRPGAGTVTRLGMAAVRRTWRAGRSLGLPLAPWIRNAMRMETWLAEPGPQGVIRETLLDPGARVAALFERGAITELLARAFAPQPRVATEVLMNLYRVELVLREIPRWCAATFAPARP